MVRITGHKIDRKSIEKTVGNSRSFQSAALREANKRMLLAKKQLIRDFENHEVTKELRSGPESSNLSGALDGYGNLFSFMGFKDGSDPAELVKKFLESFVRMKSGGRSPGLSKEFFIKMPSLNDFNFAKMPWESGNSWVLAVERGMSSFSYYMHKAYAASRSGEAMQVNHKLRGKSSRPTPYMTVILNNFRKRLSK